jgi:hypothetical protein
MRSKQGRRVRLSLLESAGYTRLMLTLQIVAQLQQEERRREQMTCK